MSIKHDVVANCEVIATNGDTGVVHWTVRYHDGKEQQIAMDGILVVTLDEHGRSVEHRE